MVALWGMIWAFLPFGSFVASSFAYGDSLRYGVCQVGCSAAIKACYLAAGYWGGVWAANAPSTIIACNTAHGTCLGICATLILGRDPGGGMPYSTKEKASKPQSKTDQESYFKPFGDRFMTHAEIVGKKAVAYVENDREQQERDKEQQEKNFIIQSHHQQSAHA
ncbi:unnamed protein product [Penicillium bialowiezense]